MPTLNAIYNLTFALWCLSEFAILIITRTRASTGEVRDQGSLRLLWITIATSITAANFAGAILHGEAFPSSWRMIPACIALLLLGLAIRFSAIYTLGRSFSANVAIHATQTLTTKGLFRFVRHPSYTGLELIFLTIGLHTRNWIGLALAVIPPSVALLYRIRVEESALTSAFGSQYTAYTAETKRLIPFIY